MGLPHTTVKLNPQRDLCADGQLFILQISCTKKQICKGHSSSRVTWFVCQISSSARCRFLTLPWTVNTSSVQFYCNSPKTASPPSIQPQVSSLHAAHGGGLGRVKSKNIVVSGEIFTFGQKTRPSIGSAVSTEVLKRRELYHKDTLQFFFFKMK